MHSDTETMLATVRQTLSHQLDTPSNIFSFPKSGKKLKDSRPSCGHRDNTEINLSFITSISVTLSQLSGESSQCIPGTDSEMLRILPAPLAGKNKGLMILMAY